MEQGQLTWIANFVWGIADDVLRDLYVRGPEHSTLANDAFPSREFDFMFSNPHYGKSWKGDLEYSLLTRSSGGGA